MTTFTSVSAPTAFGASAWRGTWRLAGGSLLVSATSAPTAGADTAETQLSLELTT